MTPPLLQCEGGAFFLYFVICTSAVLYYSFFIFLIAYSHAFTTKPLYEYCFLAFPLFAFSTISFICESKSSGKRILFITLLFLLFHIIKLLIYYTPFSIVTTFIAYIRNYKYNSICNTFVLLFVFLFRLYLLIFVEMCNIMSIYVKILKGV